MSGINFLSENLVDDATLSITTGVENAQFPLENLKNESTTNKFRSVGNTVVIEVDLQQTRDIDTIAVVGDATATFQITAMSVKTSVTTDFSGSTLIPITISAENNIGYEFITEVAHRFVEITLTGTGTFAEISNVFIGKRINLIQNSLSIQSFTYRNEDDSSIQRSDFGQKFINIFPFKKRIAGTIQYCNKSEQETLDNMYLRHGRHSPLWMIVDPGSAAMNDGQFKLAIYGYLEKMPGWNAVGGQLYNTSLEMEQAI